MVIHQGWERKSSLMKQGSKHLWTSWGGQKDAEHISLIMHMAPSEIPDILVLKMLNSNATCFSYFEKHHTLLPILNRHGRKTNRSCPPCVKSAWWSKYVCCVCLCVEQMGTSRFGSCSTHSSSLWAWSGTCSSSWCWQSTSACGLWPTPSCCRWLSVTWWWPCSACPSPSSPAYWRILSSELPCARPCPTSWVRQIMCFMRDLEKVDMFLKISQFCVK